MRAVRWAALCVALLSCGDHEGPTQPNGATGSFCHGAPDGAACDDGNACTMDDRCGAGTCLGQPVPDLVVCDDDNLCTAHDYCQDGACTGVLPDCSALDGTCVVGACDPATGECAATSAPAGTACDDGDVCTVDDGCSDAGCAGAPMDCSGDDGECLVGVCDPATGACAAQNAPDGEPCGDDDLCTADLCAAGVCHATPKCGALSGPCRLGVCDPVTGACSTENKSDGSPCDDDNPCTAGELCGGGLCSGGASVSDGTLCDDGDPCTEVGLCQAAACVAPSVDCSAMDGPCRKGACDKVSGACIAVQLADGSQCEDGDACTTGDVCSAGACESGSPGCPCSDAEDGESCDDGNACTSGDACLGGSCVGTLKDCSGLDAACLVGECSASSGDCVAVSRPDGAPCDDAQKCTEADSCVSGACVGSPTDCSDLDTECNVGVCEAATGACAIQARPELSPCDDGNPCTGLDGCKAGVCEGWTDICTSCEGKAAGDPCDDGDGCTTGETCVAGGGIMACTAPRTDCTGSVTDCANSVCHPSTGACTQVALEDGTSCSDQDACTLADTCAAGVCEGTDLPTCGSTWAACLPLEAADVSSDAVAIPAKAKNHRILGWLDASHVDWYALPMEAGGLITVETVAHCSKPVDTVLSILAPDGTTVIAQNDDNGMVKTSRLADVQVFEAGTFYARVQSLSTPVAAPYELLVTLSPAPACGSAAVCACPDHICAPLGGQNTCQFPMPLEAEPNDIPPAGLLAKGDEQRGSLLPGDVDYVSIALETGEPLTVLTTSLCGLSGDTFLTLYDTDGFTALATNDDGGDEKLSLIEGFVAPAAGTYHVAVSSPGLTEVGYVVKAQSGQCQTNADCLCKDRVCSGTAGNPGVCVPQLSVLEPAPGVTPTILLGARVHGTIGDSTDTDRYKISLQPGHYDLWSAPFCGTRVDTVLALYDPTGTTVLGIADGPDETATLSDVEIFQAGAYIVEVKGQGSVVGDYELQVRKAAP